VKARSDRVLLMLVARPGFEDLLLTRARDEARVREESADESFSWRCLEAVRDDSVFSGTHFEDLIADRQPFDVAIDGWGPPDGRLPAHSSVGLSARLEEAVDPGRSACLAGSQLHLFGDTTGTGLAYLIVRRPDLSFDQFVDYWRNQHTKLPLPRLRGYRQFYVDEAETGVLAGRLGLPAGRFDGLAEPYYTDLDEFRRTSLDPAIRQGAAIDEKNFLDHSRCAAAVFRVDDGSRSIAG
jgi:EthD domain